MKQNKTDLEGAIIKLHDVIRDLSGLMYVTGNIKKEIKFSFTSHERVLDETCRFWNITLPDLRTYRRNKELVIRRKITTRLLYMYTDRTTSQIAELLGYKNHATVLHHLKKMEEELSPEFYGNTNTKKVYKQLLNQLKLYDHDNKTNEADGD